MEKGMQSLVKVVLKKQPLNFKKLSYCYPTGLVAEPADAGPGALSEGREVEWARPVCRLKAMGGFKRPRGAGHEPQPERWAEELVCFSLLISFVWNSRRSRRKLVLIKKALVWLLTEASFGPCGVLKIPREPPLRVLNSRVGIRIPTCTSLLQFQPAAHSQ